MSVVPWEAIVGLLGIFLLISGGWAATAGKLSRIETNTQNMTNQIKQLSDSLLEQIRLDREEHHEIWGRLDELGTKVAEHGAVLNRRQS